MQKRFKLLLNHPLKNHLVISGRVVKFTEYEGSCGGTKSNQPIQDRYLKSLHNMFSHSQHKVLGK